MASGAGGGGDLDRTGGSGFWNALTPTFFGGEGGTAAATQTQGGATAALTGSSSGGGGGAVTILEDDHQGSELGTELKCHSGHRRDRADHLHPTEKKSHRFSQNLFEIERIHQTCCTMSYTAQAA